VIKPIRAVTRLSGYPWHSLPAQWPDYPVIPRSYPLIRGRPAQLPSFRRYGWSAQLPDYPVIRSTACLGSHPVIRLSAVHRPAHAVTRPGRYGRLAQLSVYPVIRGMACLRSYPIICGAAAVTNYPRLSVVQPACAVTWLSAVRPACAVTQVSVVICGTASLCSYWLCMAQLACAVTRLSALRPASVAWPACAVTWLSVVWSAYVVTRLSMVQLEQWLSALPTGLRSCGWLSAVRSACAVIQVSAVIRSMSDLRSYPVICSYVFTPGKAGLRSTIYCFFCLRPLQWECSCSKNAQPWAGAGLSHCRAPLHAGAGSSPSRACLCGCWE
jgi:hypothetical protein